MQCVSGPVSYGIGDMLSIIFEVLTFTTVSGCFGRPPEQYVVGRTPQHGVVRLGERS
jgi:hypothetical protein